MKKALIFDLDGTLWDSTRQIIPAWNECLAKLAVEKQVDHEMLCSFMGKTSEQIAQMTFPDMDQEEAHKIIVACCDAEVETLLKTGGTLYPLLRETLRKLKEQYHLYIVSNCLDGYIQSFLTYHDFWDVFEDFECIGRTGRCKGDNIRLVMERNGVDKAIYLGDTASDYAATKIAEIPFVFASYGFGKVEDVPTIGSFAEICSMAEKML